MCHRDGRKCHDSHPRFFSEFTFRGSESGFRVNVQTGGGAVRINARNGQDYTDGVSVRHPA